MSTHEYRYDLTDQPWILVLRTDGATEEVSLREVFARAHEIRQVMGDLPTQSFAVLRLLLAILHRATNGPASVTRWRQLWQAPTLPADAVDTYLDTWRPWFDLLSPDRPFYQVAGLRTDKDTMSGLERLIADAPVNQFFLTTRLGEGLERISFAEAARWLVHCHAFDVSGIKSGPVDDPRVKNGKGYALGPGPAGNLGGIIVEGENLKETLLLHLIPEDQRMIERRGEDLPAWERLAREEEQGGRHQPGGRDIDFPGGTGAAPTGPVDLYTWQSRRLRLAYDAEAVHGVLVAYGDKLTPHNLHRQEPMTAWRRSKPQEKKHGKPLVYLPREHDPERSVWRGLASLLPSTTVASGGRDGAEALPPPLLEWLAFAGERDLIEQDYILRTRAVGVDYGTQQAVIDEVVDDGVMMRVALLSIDDPELGEIAATAVATVEDTARAVGKLAIALARAEGSRDTKDVWAQARERLFARLDRPYRDWLAALDSATEPGEALAGWRQTARTNAEELGGELAADAVWARFTDIAQAESHFRMELGKIFKGMRTDEKTEVAA